MSEAAWVATKERGSLIGMKILLCCYRVLGRRLVRLLVYPIIVYYFFTAKAARQYSRQYLQLFQTQYPHHGVTASNLTIFRHLLAFAHAIIDKVGAWWGGLSRVTIRFVGQSEYDIAVNSGRGGLIIGGHLGNMEMMHALGSQTRGRKINLLMYDQHVQKFRKMMTASMGSERVNCIAVDSIGPDTMLLLQDKLAQGEFLYVAGDRIPIQGDHRIGHVEFLGQQAAFAQGPYILAHLLGCPVYLFFCIEQAGSYHACFENFATEVRLDRRQRDQQIQVYQQLFAKRLEYYCTQAPLQWFNFFDFWHSVK